MKKVIVVIISVLMLAVIVAAVLKKHNMLNKESIEKIIKVEDKNESNNGGNNVNGEDAEGNIKFENRGDITDRDVIPRYGLNEKVEVKSLAMDESAETTYVLYETIEKVEMLEKVDIEFEEKDGLGGCLEKDGTVKDGVKLCAVTMKLENPNNIAVKFNREKISIIDKGAEYNLWGDGEPEYTDAIRLFERNVGEENYTIRPQHDGYLVIEAGETIEREIVYECFFENDGSVLVNMPDVSTDEYEGVSVVDLK